jgi:hypothetical protein
VILSISTVVTLLGFGTIFLIYPYLYHVADSVLFVTKAVARPLVPVLIKTILFVFRPMAENAQTVTPQTDGQGLSQKENHLTDMDSFVVGEWESLILKAVGWGVLGFIGLVFLMGAGAFLIYVIRMMLKRSRDEAIQPLSAGAIWAFIRVLAGLPLHMWRALTSVLKGLDCAAMVYAGLCRWGRRSGLPPKHNETPQEFGKRLSNSFPVLKNQIELIVHAFNREVYGQTPTGRDMLSRLRKALRHMRRISHLPIRVKVWFLR